MDYFLGVDIGTTSVKAIAFHDSGEIICRHAVSYEMQHPQPGYSEQDPEEIFAGVVSAINQVIGSLQPLQPAFISFSAAMHSFIAVDDQGLALTSCIIWADNRAAAIAEKLLETARGLWFYHTTGVPVHAMSPFCKLLWLKEHKPDVFAGAYKFIGIKEFVFYKLCAEYAVDKAIASATGLLNLGSLQWDQFILDFVGLAEKKLSTVVPVEQVFYYKQDNHAYLPGLSPATPLVIGGSDGALANLGTGSLANSSLSVTIGTSGAVRLLSDRPVTAKAMSIFCYHAMDGRYIIGGASNNGAIVIQWLKDSLLQTAESFQDLFHLAENAGDQTGDLYFLPYLLGERAPLWNSEAKGVFFGFTINHTKAHLVRAAMEGITFNLYSIAKQIMQLMPVTEIYAAGGFAQSASWLQLLADIFNCPVMVSGSLENSALGAVMVGIRALELPVVIKPAVVAGYQPNLLLHEQYEIKHRKFERLYNLLKSEFTSQATATMPA